MPILRSSVMQTMFINECKSCEISNQMLFNMFSFLKTKANCLWHKYCKIKLSSSTILHFESKELEAYLESSQISVKEHFCKNS